MDLTATPLAAILKAKGSAWTTPAEIRELLGVQGRLQVHGYAKDGKYVLDRSRDGKYRVLVHHCEPIYCPGRHRSP